MRNFAFKLLLIFAIVVIFLAGCVNTPNRPGYLTPAFIGFSQAELDTIVVRAYEANGNFNHLLDTLTVTKSDWWIDQPAGDTTVIETNHVSGPALARAELCPGYDWEVYIPAVKKTIFISNIIFDQTYTRNFILADKKAISTAPVISYNQDGQLTPAHEAKIGPYSYAYDGPQVYYDYLVYIHK